MKAKSKRILIIVLSLVLVAALAAGGTVIYKKNFAPVYASYCNLLDLPYLIDAADYFQLQTEKAELKKKISKGYKRVRLSDSALNDLSDYLKIGQAFSLKIDIDAAKAVLANCYNPERKLLTVTGLTYEDGTPATYPVEMEFALTLSVVRQCPLVLEWEEFSLREGILNAVSEWNYLLPIEYKDEDYHSFPNAGGIALGAIDLLQRADGADYKAFLPGNTEAWYQAWKAYYAENGFSVADVIYFYPAAMVMEGECSVEVLQDYYEKLTPQDTIGIGGALQLLPLVDASKNPDFLDAFKASVLQMMEDYQFFRN